MNVWRLCKKRHAVLDGEGARLYGGRWNSVGKAVVYTASSLSLALLEQLVRLDPDEIPDDFVRMEIAIPDVLLSSKITLKEFPIRWKEASEESWFRKRGDTWLEKCESAMLIVPSVIVPEETAVLINPVHPHAHKIEILGIQPFRFDSRLFSSF